MSMSDLETVLNEYDYAEISESMANNDPVCGPRILELHPTNRCNTSCYFCNQATLHHQQDESALPIIKKLLQSLKLSGLRGVRISGGGEPTVYPGLIELLSTIKHLGLSLTRFNTNGILLDDQLCDALLDCRLALLHVSVQSPTPRSWQQLTGRSEGLFRKVIAGIERMRRLGVNSGLEIIATFVLDETTVRLVREADALCTELGIKGVLHDLNMVRYSPAFVKKKIDPMIVAVRSGEINLESLSVQLWHIKVASPSLDTDSGNVFGIKQVSPYKNIHNAGEKLCFAPWTGALLRPNGDVYLCCALGSSSHKLGNIKESDFFKIWNHENMHILRKMAWALFVDRDPAAQRAALGLSSESYFAPWCVKGCAAQHGMFSHSRLASEILLSHTCDT